VKRLCHEKTEKTGEGDRNQGYGGPGKCKVKALDRKGRKKEKNFTGGALRQDASGGRGGRTRLNNAAAGVRRYTFGG